MNAPVGDNRAAPGKNNLSPITLIKSTLMPSGAAFWEEKCSCGREKAQRGEHKQSKFTFRVPSDPSLASLFQRHRNSFYSSPCTSHGCGGIVVENFITNDTFFTTQPPWNEAGFLSFFFGL